MSENDLGMMQQAKVAGIIHADTASDRKARERQARTKDDGRSNRTRTPSVTFTVNLPPEVKARITALCRRNDILIKDFVLECLELGFAGYGDK